ncbi:Uncharacterised protein [uncultured archaeon]|nr:Uncharacterised protein [uncultured archaeon]
MNNFKSFWNNLTSGFKKNDDFEKKQEELFSFLVSPSKIKINPDYIQINEMYDKIVQIVGYPRSVEDGWLKTFLTQNENYDISIFVKPINIESTLTYLHNQIIAQKSDLIESESRGTPNTALEVKLKDTIRLYEMLYKGEEKLFKVSFYVDNKENNLEALNSLLEKCKSNLNSLLMIPKTTDYLYDKAFKSILPIGVDELEVDKEFNTKALAASFPFISTSDHKKRGILFAHDKITKNPIYIDFDSLANKHFFVLGISGSGKSYSAKYLLKQMEAFENNRVLILDPNDEYSKLVRKMKGKVVEISKDSNSMINVFDLAGEDFGTKMLSLVTVFDIITGGLSEAQKGVLGDILINTYERKGIKQEDEKTWNKTPPTFKDFYETLADGLRRLDKFDKRRASLESKSYEVLLNRTKNYVRGGFFGFMDSQTKIDAESRVLSFDLSKLPSPVKPLLMFTVLDFLVRQIKKDKSNKVLIIDEGWSLLKSKEAENYVLEFVKNSRRYGAAVGFITQDLEDLLDSDGGRGILNMTQTKVLFRQNTSNIDALCKTLKLNDYEKEALITAEKGNGVLITGDKHFRFFIETSKMMHDLITTNPNEQNAISFKPLAKRSEEVNDVFNPKNYFVLERKLISSEVAYHIGKLRWQRVTASIFEDGKPEAYLVDCKSHEGPLHALLCYGIANELRKYTDFVILSATREPDVVAVLNTGKQIAFEIETGSNLKSNHEEFLKKMEKNKEKYDDCYIVVTDSNLVEKYRPYGKVLKRSEFKQKLLQLV